MIIKNRFLKNILSLLSIVMGAVAVISLLLVLLGYRPFILSSASMEPLFTEGNLVWCDTGVPLKDIAMGDIIIYRSDGGKLVMHRVVTISPPEHDLIKATLRGDANEEEQTISLSRTNFVGKEKFNIPWLGNFVASILSVKWGVWIAATLFFLLACVPKRGKSLLAYGWYLCRYNDSYKFVGMLFGKSNFQNTYQMICSSTSTGVKY